MGALLAQALPAALVHLSHALTWSTFCWTTELLLASHESVLNSRAAIAGLVQRTMRAAVENVHDLPSRMSSFKHSLSLPRNASYIFCRVNNIVLR